MVKGFVKLTGLFLIGLLTWMTACTQDSTTTSTDDVTNYVEDALTEIRDSANVGRGHCYELVFPVTIVFPNATTVEVDSFPELKTALRDWKIANPTSTERPSLKFPVSVINKDGEIITVSDEAGLKTLRDSCDMGEPHGPRGPRGGHGRGPRGGGHGNGGECACFQIVFPVTIAFPDGTTKQVADQRAFQDAIKTWRQANPTATAKPELKFPVTVKLSDGTTQAIANAEALKALKESCTDDTGN